MRLDMLPNSPADHVMQIGFADSIFSCKDLTVAYHIGTPNCSHFSSSQFTGPMFFPAAPFDASLQSGTAFIPRILLIVSISTKEKMVGPDTSFVIASMANKQSFRNFSEMEQPGVPMASYFRRRVHSINADFTISNPLAFTPQPTAFSFSDISPKPYFAGNLDVNSIPSRDIIGTSAAAKFSFRARGNENALAV